MTSLNVESLRNIAVIAHGGAGKTSLIEAMLFDTGSIDRLGNVEDGTTTTDYEPEEIERKITITSSIAFCDWKSHRINLIDTPGFINFLEETRGSLRAVDGAVVIVSAISGVKAETQKIWQYASEQELPKLVFVNKMDKESANFSRAVGEVEKAFETDALPLQLPIGTGENFSGIVDLIKMQAFTFSGGKAHETDIPSDMASDVEEYRKQLVENPELSAFFKPFLNMDKGISEEEKQVLITQAQTVIMEGVVPAYERLLNFFEDEYFVKARNTLGATSLPGGKRFYDEQIYRYATVDMSADEIHQLGLSEVARIRKEMEAIIEDLEFEGSFADFIQFLRSDPQFYAKTPHELLAEASYFAKKTDGRLPQLFGKLPRQPYGVAPVPDDIAPFYTGGRYVGSPLEARKGGYYWVNTYALESRTLYTLPALTLHEAMPGHHLQISLALEQGEQPDFRRNDYISAYGEGWALYAEKLGIEMNIYETPYQDFGRLTYEMWRACRLVIDTGIHAKGWSRQQALDYLSSNTALSIHEVTTEIDRYISWPAQALSYKLGEYTIWQLRREAESRLGAEFDLRGFHDFILALGSVPLEILKDEVHRWIAEQVEA
jgi:small GTP-binding protein